MTGNAPLIVILGPTASGKTQLAITLAQALNGEIIGADSRQIYRYMDIGTAKPTPDQQQAAVHHLIDIVVPDENLGLAQYQRLANDTITDIQRRGRLPLLVGGTGQYITAVIEGWSIPEVPPDAPLRAELEGYAQQHGSQALHDRLREVDAPAAEAIHHRNVRRVIRALEVYHVTGTPITQLQQKNPQPWSILQFGLNMERQSLYDRADQRVDAMMQAGFLDEVRKLLNMNYNQKLPSMSGLGYRQLVDHLQGTLSLQQAIDETKTATHDFIRRQYTWFNGHDTGIQWLQAGHYHADQVVIQCEQWLKGIN